MWTRRLLLVSAVLMACQKPPPDPDEKSAAIEAKAKSDPDTEKASPKSKLPKADPEDSGAGSDAIPPSTKEALHEAFDKLCHARERSGADKMVDPNEAAVRTADWIKAEVTDPHVLHLLKSLPSMPPKGRAETLRVRAALAGVDPCPMGLR